MLFEGINYIYTNCSNVAISVIYPKDNEFNRTFLNNYIYNNHKNNSRKENIYYKEVFSKMNDELNAI